MFYPYIEPGHLEFYLIKLTNTRPESQQYRKYAGPAKEY